MGSPSAHIRSFQDSQSSLSAWRIRVSPWVRSSADRCASTVVIARALPSSLVSALRSPPDRGVGWCFGAIRVRHRESWPAARQRLLLERGPAAVVLMTAGPDLTGVVEQPLPDVLPDRLRPRQ